MKNFNNDFLSYIHQKKEPKNTLKSRVSNFFQWAINNPDNVVRGSYNTIEILFIALLAYGSYNCFTSNMTDGFILGCVLAYMTISKIWIEYKINKQRISA